MLSQSPLELAAPAEKPCDRQRPVCSTVISPPLSQLSLKDRQRDLSVLHLSLRLPSLKVKDRRGDRSVLLTYTDTSLFYTGRETGLFYAERDTGLFTQSERPVCLHRQKDRPIYTGRGTGLVYTGRDLFCSILAERLGLHRHRPIPMNLFYTGRDRSAVPGLLFFFFPFLHRQRPVLFYIGRDTLRAPLSNTFLQRLKEGCRKPVLGSLR